MTDNFLVFGRRAGSEWVDVGFNTLDIFCRRAGPCLVRDTFFHILLGVLLLLSSGFSHMITDSLTYPVGGFGDDEGLKVSVGSAGSLDSVLLPSVSEPTFGVVAVALPFLGVVVLLSGETARLADAR